MNPRPGGLHTPLRPDVEALIGADIPTFPCGRDKRPLVAGGFKSATTDREIIKRWLCEHPDALMGVPTGAAIGVDVIDLDVDKQTGELIGEASAERLGLDLVAHAFVARTPSGGAHVFFKAEGLRSTVKKVPGVDTRVDGGYVIAWEPQAVITAVQAARSGTLPTLPTALREALTTKGEKAGKADAKPAVAPPQSPPRSREEAYARAALKGVAAELADTGHGGRNHALNAIAYRMGRMIAAGWIDDPTVRAALENAAADCGAWRDDGAKQCRATIMSGLSAGKKEPHPPLADRADARLDFGTDDLSDEYDMANPTSDTPAGRVRGKLKLMDQNRPYEHEPELIRDMIPAIGVGFLGGQSGAYKTFVALDLAVSVATGEPFAGRKVEARGAVIYVAFEGGPTIEGRLKARRSRLPDPEAELAIGVVDDFVQLSTDRDWLDFKATVDAHAAAMRERFGLPLRLVEIDTATAGAMIPADGENDPAWWTRIFRKFDPIARKHRCVVVLTHHAGKNASAGLRGSSAARAAADFVLMASCVRDEITGESGQRMLALAKARNGREGIIAEIEADEVEIGQRPDGSPVTTLVMGYRLDVNGAAAKERKPERMFREAYEERSTNPGRTPPASTMSATPSSLPMAAKGRLATRRRRRSTGRGELRRRASYSQPWVVRR